ncbi:hypothetical protein [Paraburkholderia sp. DHOC27]|uniref:hypothetical protein n=1 Tax=Paraburkholderia sp. DHOC27 TaxID=2303330 RepID=UPI000E3D8906|nr:hypothetical protein [Paraburkholderia sp. DHOC27]RFU44481.1 hypothetical protein D0B32_28165 [Paraburkholderia sp. DHOC27]
MEISGTTNASTSGIASQGEKASSSNNDVPSFQSLLGELGGFAKGTPAQRMWTTILAQLGITPEQLQKMTPAEQKKVEDQVKEIIKKNTQAEQQAVQSPQPASGVKTGTAAKKHVSIDIEV